MELNGNRKQQISGILLWAVPVMLFLFAFNLFNKFYYWGLAAFVLFAIYFCLTGLKLRVDLYLLLLFLFSLSYGLFDPMGFWLPTFIKNFIYPMFYVMGLYLAENESGRQDRSKFLLYISVISLGFLAYYAANMIYNFVLGTDRVLVLDFWTGGHAEATLQGAIAAIPLSVSVALFFIKCKPAKKIFALAVCAAALLFCGFLSTRNLYVMIVLLIAVCYIYCTVITDNPVLRRRLIVIAVICLLVLFFVIFFNVAGIRDLLMSIEAINRIFTEEWVRPNDPDPGRIVLKWWYIREAPQFLWGGENIRNEIGKHAHDLILDVYDTAGIVPAVLLLAFVIAAAAEGIRFAFNRKADIRYRFIIIAVFTGVYSMFFLEPVIQGAPWLFAAFCFIFGMERAN